MYKIAQITDDSKQKQILILPDGSPVTFHIEFIPMQYSWFIRELTYSDLTIYNLRISNSPNILHQWKNKIPFGLACFSKDNREPTQQKDFSSGNSVLYILSEEEVAQYTGVLTGG